MANSSSELISNVRVVGNSVVACIAGEIDLHNSPTLRGQLLRLLDEKPTKRLVLNLAAVPYMDSSAIAVMVETLKRLRGGKLCLTDLQPRVKGLLEIARLETIFDIYKDETAALG
jgi:anti-anti-sigma factor